MSFAQYLLTLAVIFGVLSIIEAVRNA